MTKIYFNYDKINNQILPSVSNAKSYVAKANTKSNSMDIPGDFKYLKSLKNVRNNIKSLDKDMRNIREWLENSKTKYKEISSRMDADVSKLTISEIERRDKILS